MTIVFDQTLENWLMKVILTLQENALLLKEGVIAVGIAVVTAVVTAAVIVAAVGTAIGVFEVGHGIDVDHAQDHHQGVIARAEPGHHQDVIEEVDQEIENLKKLQ